MNIAGCLREVVSAHKNRIVPTHCKYCMKLRYSWLLALPVERIERPTETQRFHGCIWRSLQRALGFVRSRPEQPERPWPLKLSAIVIRKEPSKEARNIMEYFAPYKS